MPNNSPNDASTDVATTISHAVNLELITKTLAIASATTTSNLCAISDGMLETVNNLYVSLAASDDQLVEAVDVADERFQSASDAIATAHAQELRNVRAIHNTASTQLLSSISAIGAMYHSLTGVSLPASAYATSTLPTLESKSNHDKR